jgi:VWFA-related protein
MRQPTVFVFLLALVLAAPVARPGAAQVEAAPPASGKVTLDVVVKDKKWHAIPDLRPEEVEVYENGSRRPVESLRFVQGGSVAPEEATGPGTLVSLVFDGLDPNQQKLAREAAEDLLGQTLGPDTWIAVFRIGLQLWTVQPFTRDLALVRQAVDQAASSLDNALAEPDAQARRGVAATLALLSQGKATDPREVARAEILGRIIRQGDRLQRQRQDQSPIYLLLALAKGQASAPGRKVVLYFTTGFEVPGLLDDVFKATMSEANRANVAFYGMDVRGLDTTREGDLSRSALGDVARTSMGQSQKASQANRAALEEAGQSQDGSSRATTSRTSPRARAASPRSTPTTSRRRWKGSPRTSAATTSWSTHGRATPGTAPSRTSR